MERIVKVWFDKNQIHINTDQGKNYGRPLEFFPLLKEATDAQREAYRINKFGDALRWEDIVEDIHISSFYETAQPEPDNIIAEVFNRFPQLNVSEVARTIGIHKSLLSKYIYGTKKPSLQRTKEILDTLRQLGQKLASI